MEHSVRIGVGIKFTCAFERDTEHEALPNQLSYVTDFAQKPMFVLAAVKVSLRAAFWQLR